MEFLRERVFTSLNADELKQGDKVIVADNMTSLRTNVEHGQTPFVIKDILIEDERARFRAVGFGVENDGLLAYLVERKENCTKCRLCNGSIKDDPTEVCENYEPQVEPPANCETCSKADTDRCPVPNPPKETGCGHWEPKPARVCENCRNLERHGKDSNWCEVRELRLSDEAIKKNTCGYLKLVKAEPHYRPFKDTGELIKVWDAKYRDAYGLERINNGLDMPHIWVRYKINQCGQMGILITKYEKNYVQIDGDMIAMHALMADYEFLDGSPCGVEE